MNGAAVSRQIVVGPKTTARKIVSVFMMLFGTFMLIIGFAATFAAPGSPGQSEAEAARDRAIGIPILLLLGAAPLGIGIMLFRGAKKVDREHATRSMEQAVINVAAENGGVVTLAMVMHGARISSTEASAVLNELCRQGIAEPDLLAEGGVEYRFTGLTGPI